MAESGLREDPSPPAPAAKPTANRWAKLGGKLKRYRGPIAAIAAFGAVLSGFLGYWSAYQAVENIIAPKSAGPRAANAGPLSIVVLPFRNLTGSANDDYFADGLTATLTADLSRIRNVFIVDAATAFSYKTRSATAQQVGKDLGVRFVLQGTVQRNGTRIRINVQLADSTSNAQLWSDSFDGDQSDLFALQDRVTARVGNSIGREMVIVAARETETRKSSPKVSDLMLRARALGLKSGGLENDQLQEALYRQVLAVEPSNASAMVSLADVLTEEADNFFVNDESTRDRKLAEARDLIAKATEIDPDIPGIYSVVGGDAFWRGDIQEAQRAFETYVSLRPTDPSGYNNLAFVFFNAGEPKRAIELLNHAVALNPRHHDQQLLFQMCRAYFMLGDNDATIVWCRKALEHAPRWPAETYAYLAMAHATKGEDAKARDAAAEVRRLGPNTKLSTFKDAPQSFAVAAYRQLYESRLVPAWRKAGLPE